MDLAEIPAALARNPLGIVFATVLAEQLGLPLPAVPVLLLAGSLATSAVDGLTLLAAAVVASILGDAAWFLAGRWFGYRVLTGLCRLSINPGSCVTQTEARFVRWGLVSLVVAKFIPGFSVIAPPIAGALRMSFGGFVLAAGAGAALWAGLAMAAGWLLRDSVRVFLAWAERRSGLLLLGVAAALGLWVAWKLWRKREFARDSRLAHIGIEELRSALAGPEPPLLVDLRGPALRRQDGALAGAVASDLEGLPDAVAHWPKNRAIVTLCACPQDASAVAAARRLLDAGYLSVRPLRGGYTAWLEGAARAGVAERLTPIS